jgi:opacity protein-like surface antigen
MKYRILLGMMLWAAASSVSAQSLWTSAEAKARLARGLNVYAEGEYRTTDGMDATERWAGSLGVDYRLIKPLKIGAGYTYIHQRQAESYTRKGNVIPAYWQPKHRWHLDLTASLRTGRLLWSLRERYQLTHRTAQSVAKYDSDGSAKSDEQIEAQNKQVLRSRLQAEYLIGKSRFRPYASAEVYNALDEGFDYTKSRFTLGTEYKLNKQHELDVFYRYIHKDDSDEGAGHVIGVGYTFKCR